MPQSGMLEENGSCLEHAVVLADGPLDWPMMNDARYSIASPLADSETREGATIRAYEDYY